MDESYIVAIAEQLNRGNAALWLGSAWDPLNTDALSAVARCHWAAVWSERREATIASAIKANWESHADALVKRRIVHEVPGRIEASLGTYYSFSEFCPVFYLNGTAGDTMTARELRRARDEKVDELSRLRSGILLVAGISDQDQIVNFLLDECQSAPDDVQFLICGVEERTLDGVARRIGTSNRSLFVRLRCWPEPLISVLERVFEADAAKTPDVPSIKVGAAHIPLAPLLGSNLDPPLDQFFEIITSDMVGLPGQEENPARLRNELVRGRGGAWRAFAHRLQWQRNSARVDWIQQVYEHEFSKDAPLVVNVNIVGEPGSGLTTCLHELAFRLALLGSPTLVHRSDSRTVDYDGLRMFLERLGASGPGEDLSGGIGRVRRATPTLVFDGTDPAQDAVNNLRHLPVHLANDGRTALVLRGITIRDASKFDADFRAEQRIDAKYGKVKEIWYDQPLRAKLSPAERESLSEWAKSNFDFAKQINLEAIINAWGKDWHEGSPETPPLLICLYFILRGSVASSSELGRHLFERMRPLFDAAPAESVSASNASDAPLSDEEIIAARELLRRKFESTSERDDSANPRMLKPALPLVQVSRRDVANVVALLSAFGALRLGVSRSALGALANIGADGLAKILADLEEYDLANTTLLANGGRIAPSAYYSGIEKIGLRHPAYGRLILEWLNSPDGGDDCKLISSDWLDQFLEKVQADGIGPYPIWLLEPVLKRIGPTSAYVRLAEEITTRFLRIQKLKGSDYHKWVFGNFERANDQRERVYQLFESIADEVVRQRSVILHSRGMTRYKSCRASTPFSESAKRFLSASNDFDLALSRSIQEVAGEAPAHVLTSKGLSYMYRANLEREQPSHSENEAAEFDDIAHRCLREALEYKSDNPYAAYGLAEFLINRCERIAISAGANLPATDGASKHAGNLAEACELLQMEPTDAYRTEWEELWRRLLLLLKGQFVRAYIAKLKGNGEELGYALDALRELGGRIPMEITTDPGEVEEINLARAILDEASGHAPSKSALASLLRYALFTAHPDRIASPAYNDRFSLILEIEGTAYLQRPIWLFDFGMLSLQTRHIDAGLEAFRRLRQGRRFFDVPLERTVYLASDERTTEPQKVVIRISRIDQDGKGWARPDNLPGFTEAIPFSAEDFKKFFGNLQYGRTLCRRFWPSAFATRRPSHERQSPAILRSRGPDASGE